ncbi:MAG: hypothetical protein KFKLKKLM_02094 [Flavobacteriales bacterium]|nr:hypothetical protein [Flavobacteriales bacterium]
MKKITLLLATVFTTTMVFSQVIVKLTSVPCNTGLEGTYPFGETDYAEASPTWTLHPNMFDGNNAVTGALEFIEDGTPGIVGDGVDTDTWSVPAVNNGASMGVPPLQNVPKAWLAGDTTNYLSQDLTGKIAVCYRGFYEFGFKAYNAQLRGAVGVIIINHTGDPIPMGAGTYGNKVTIPVVMLGRIAGDDLRLAIESCTPGTVTAFIGTKVGVNTNDIGANIKDIVMPNDLSIPSNVAVNGTNYPVDLGIWSYNYGVNAQNGVTASVTVNHEVDGQVYTNTAAPLDYLAPNLTTFEIDTQYFDLGTFAPATWTQGEYAITYTLNLPGDEDPSDNTFTINFRITADIFSKGRTDAGNQPIASTTTAPNEISTPLDDWEHCIVFESPVVASSTSGGGQLLGMTFSSSPINTTMSFEVLEIRAYTWNDANPDFANITFTSLNQETSGLYFFPGTPDSLDNIYVAFDTPIALNNNQKYLFCVYNASDELRLGYDSKIDYTSTINNYLKPISPLRTLPSGGSDTWYRDGFGWETIPAISATIDFPTSVNNAVVNEVAALPYPNPAVNMLNVPVRKGVKGAVTVEVLDLTGKVVLSENKTIGEGPLKINVASIANGSYLFNLTFADGSKDTFKASVNR